jgi:hypothetical protein
MSLIKEIKHISFEVIKYFLLTLLLIIPDTLKGSKIY